MELLELLKTQANRMSGGRRKKEVLLRIGKGGEEDFVKIRRWS